MTTDKSLVERLHALFTEWEGKTWYSAAEFSRLRVAAVAVVREALTAPVEGMETTAEERAAWMSHGMYSGDQYLRRVHRDADKAASLAAEKDAREKAEAALKTAAMNLTEASRAVERASSADPKTVARLAFHVQKMAVAARAALGEKP